MRAPRPGAVVCVPVRSNDKTLGSHDNVQEAEGEGGHAFAQTVKTSYNGLVAYINMRDTLMSAPFNTAL